MTAGSTALPSATLCPQCGTELAPSLTSCPSCHVLVHGTRLGELATQAEAEVAAGNLSAGLAHWREALELLPINSSQYQAVADRIAELGRRVDAVGKEGQVKNERPVHRRIWSAIVAGGIFLLSKIKLLLLGLTKITTLLSMLVYFGVYWELWGWKFALGLVLSIYIHEMGHMAAFHRYGMKTTAPMFIPGFGALIRYRQAITDPRQEARVGLAGPLWGLGAALACYSMFRITGDHSWAAIAKMGGFINLFNLIPIWQLDGGHGFKALTRPQRWVAAAAIGACWAVTSQGMLILLGIGAAYQALSKKQTRTGDTLSFVSYIALVGVLSWLAGILVDTTG